IVFNSEPLFSAFNDIDQSNTEFYTLSLHDALPISNVFQICTLNETTSTIKKRQEIGRGLRLAVDQSGERVTDNGYTINTLTVVANETYAEFTSALQKEIEEDEGIRFGVVEQHSFASITVSDDQGELSYLGVEQSERSEERR